MKKFLNIKAGQTVEVIFTKIDNYRAMPESGVIKSIHESESIKDRFDNPAEVITLEKPNLGGRVKNLTLYAHNIDKMIPL